MKSTLKVFQVLEVLCEGGDARVSHLSKDLGIKYATMHRILSTLSEAGYVEKNQATSEYRATLKIYRLGLKVRKMQPLVGLAKPYMERLAARWDQTVNLADFVDNHAVVIERCESGEPFITDHTMGRQLPAYCTAFGKVFLAGMSPDELHTYAASVEFRPYTNRTITSVEELIPKLEQIRQQGFAVDERELDDGVRCVAAPIKNEQGNVIGAISISGRTGTMSAEKLEECRVSLVEAAGELSESLGYEQSAGGNPGGDD
jgi:DNA-binding IclR family transcriptional regulator